MYGWILLIIIVICLWYYIYKNRGSPHRTIKKIETLHEIKVKEPNVIIGPSVNKEYNKGLEKLRLSLETNNDFHKDDTFFLNKVLSDIEVDKDNYLWAHELYARILDIQEYKIAIQPHVDIIQKKKKLKNKVEYRVDKQNVHDSVMNAEVDKQLNMLQTNSTLTTYDAFLYNLNDTKVNKFLDSTKGTTYKGRLESSIFEDVWIKAQKYGDDGINAFVESVKDCVRDDGYIHCTTGRVDRVLSSLAGFEGDFGIFKNTDVLKQEAIDKCAIILDRMSVNGEPEDDEIKKEITIQLTKDYSHIDPMILRDIITTCTNF